jgi:putative addiction module component (TIGR02574 family)
MVLALDEIMKAALALPPAERELLVERLSESLADVPVAYEEEWREELKHRADDLDAGRTRLIPGEEVMAAVDALLTRSHQ